MFTKRCDVHLRRDRINSAIFCIINLNRTVFIDITHELIQILPSISPQDKDQVLDFLHIICCFASAFIISVDQTLHELNIRHLDLVIFKWHKRHFSPGLPFIPILVMRYRAAGIHAPVIIIDEEFSFQPIKCNVVFSPYLYICDSFFRTVFPYRRIVDTDHCIQLSVSLVFPIRDALFCRDHHCLKVSFCISIYLQPSNSLI